MALALAAGHATPAAALRTTQEGRDRDALTTALVTPAPSSTASPIGSLATGLEEVPSVTQDVIKAIAGKVLGLPDPAAYRDEPAMQTRGGLAWKKYWNEETIPDEMGELAAWINDPQRIPITHQYYPRLDGAIANQEAWRWAWEDTQTIDWRDPVVRAAMAHWVLTHIIHPFENGNHRVGWEVMNLIRRRAGLPAIEFRPSWRQDYNDSFQLNDDFLPFLEFVRSRAAAQAGLEEGLASDVPGLQQLVDGLKAQGHVQDAQALWNLFHQVDQRLRHAPLKDARWQQRRWFVRVLVDFLNQAIHTDLSTLKSLGGTTGLRGRYVTNTLTFRVKGAAYRAHIELRRWADPLAVVEISEEPSGRVLGLARLGIDRELRHSRYEPVRRSPPHLDLADQKTWLHRAPAHLIWSRPALKQCLGDLFDQLPQLPQAGLEESWLDAAKQAASVWQDKGWIAPESAYVFVNNLRQAMPAAAIGASEQDVTRRQEFLRVVAELLWQLTDPEEAEPLTIQPGPARDGYSARVEFSVAGQPYIAQVHQDDAPSRLIVTVSRGNRQVLGSLRLGMDASLTKSHMDCADTEPGKAWEGVHRWSVAPVWPTPVSMRQFVARFFSELIDARMEHPGSRHRTGLEESWLGGLQRAAEAWSRADAPLVTSAQTRDLVEVFDRAMGFAKTQPGQSPEQRLRHQNFLRALSALMERVTNPQQLQVGSWDRDSWDNPFVVVKFQHDDLTYTARLTVQLRNSPRLIVVIAGGPHEQDVLGELRLGTDKILRSPHLDIAGSSKKSAQPWLHHREMSHIWPTEQEMRRFVEAFFNASMAPLRDRVDAAWTPTYLDALDVGELPFFRVTAGLEEPPAPPMTAAEAVMHAQAAEVSHQAHEVFLTMRPLKPGQSSLHLGSGPSGLPVAEGFLGLNVDLVNLTASGGTAAVLDAYESYQRRTGLGGTMTAAYADMRQWLPEQTKQWDHMVLIDLFISDDETPRWTVDDVEVFIGQLIRHSVPDGTILISGLGTGELLRMPVTVNGAGWLNTQLKLQGIPFAKQNVTNQLPEGTADTELWLFRLAPLQEQITAIMDPLGIGQGPRAVVVSQDVARQYPGLAVLAELGRRVEIDRGAATIRNLHEAGVTNVDYFGARADSRAFWERADELKMPMHVSAHDPGSTEFRQLLAQILSALSGLTEPRLAERVNLDLLARWLEQTV